MNLIDEGIRIVVAYLSLLSNFVVRYLLSILLILLHKLSVLEFSGIADEKAISIYVSCLSW